MLGPELSALHQRTLADNVIANIAPSPADVVEGEVAMPHPPEVMNEIGDFFRDTRERAGRSLLMPWACGTRKTTTGMFVARLAGVGQASQEEDHLTGLYVVSSDLGRGQLAKTQRKYLPDADMGKLMPSTDIEDFWGQNSFGVVTYQGISMMEEEKWREVVRHVDLLILDEGHLACARIAKERFKTAKAVTTMIVMSGTPDWNPNRRTQEELEIEHVLTPITERDAIRMGLTNGVHLLTMFTGAKAVLPSRGPKIADEDLADLARDRERNDLLVETLVDADRMGLTSLTKCIPGDNSWHARHIAERVQAYGVKIEPLVDFLKLATRRKNIKDFLEGRIQHLTSTRMTDNTFDPPNGVGLLLLAGPFGSWVEVGQFTGRASRKRPDGRPTLVIATVDEIQSVQERRLILPADIYGITTADETIIDVSGVRTVLPVTHPARSGSQGSRASSPRSSRARRDIREEELVGHFSDLALAALSGARRGALLDDVLILPESLIDAPEGYDLISKLPMVVEGKILYVTARDALLRAGVDADEQPLFVVVDGRNCTHMQRAEAYLRQEYESHTIPVAKRREINSFLETVIGWPHPADNVIMDASGAAGVEPYSEGTGTANTWKLEDTRALLLELGKYPFVDPDVVISLTDLSRALGKSQDFIGDYVRSHPREFADDVERKQYRAGQGFAPYKRVDTITIEAATPLLERVMLQSKRLQTMMQPRAIVEAAQAQARANIEKNVRVSKLDPAKVDEFIDGLSTRPEVNPSSHEKLGLQGNMDLVKTSTFAALESLAQPVSQGLVSPRDRHRIAEQLATIQRLGWQVLERLEGPPLEPAVPQAVPQEPDPEPEISVVLPVEPLPDLESVLGPDPIPELEAEVVPGFSPVTEEPQAPPVVVAPPLSPLAPPPPPQTRVSPETEEVVKVEQPAANPTPAIEQESLTSWGLVLEGRKLFLKGDPRVTQGYKDRTLAAIRLLIAEEGSLNEHDLWDLLDDAFPDQKIDMRKVRLIVNEIKSIFEKLRATSFLKIEEVTVKGSKMFAITVSTGEKFV